MQIIRKRAYARAGLLGNPSDGYNGKTISVIVRNFYAETVLYEWDKVEILLSEHDRATFRSVHELNQDVQLHGYYGGIRLIKATIKRFVDYCQAQGIELHDHNFSIRYGTSIPANVGMAGSSAIITATLRCLMEFYGVDIPLAAQPTLVLSVETEELRISAGLQDRVVQCYEGTVYMDFDKAGEREVGGLRAYQYELLDDDWQPPIYVAYHAKLGEPTEAFHNDIRGRYDRGEFAVVDGMQQFAQYAYDGRQAWMVRDATRLNELIDANFDLRQKLFQLPAWQVQMVEMARTCGASAKFAGSGGAVVGLYRDEEGLRQLRDAMDEIGCRVVVPKPKQAVTSVESAL